MLQICSDVKLGLGDMDETLLESIIIDQGQAQGHIKPLYFEYNYFIKAHRL